MPTAKRGRGRKAQTAMEYIMSYSWVLVIIVVAVAVLFYLGLLKPLVSLKCTFPSSSGFSCVQFRLNSSIDLNSHHSFYTVDARSAGEGNFRLKISQSTGHPIQITSVMCTQNMTFLGLAPMQDINIFNRKTGNHWSCTHGTQGGCLDQIDMSSGEEKVVAGRIGTEVGAVVYCTGTGVTDYSNDAQLIPYGIPSTSDRATGNIYKGKIYIEYTELDTGMIRIVVGDIIAGYESY